jgi:RNA polymerase sigma factor (sigma-70 family)
MTGSRSGSVLRGFRSIFGGGSLVGVGEGALLERFVADRDEAAFEALVARHGPMVLGVCRRVLDDPGDIDDAFQATFLVLVKKAGQLRDRDLLSNWLYGVAHRVAVRARANRYRLRTRERPGGMEAALSNEPREDCTELRAVLDDELARLPGWLRETVVLCDLEGLPQEEVARRLGCAVGTIKSRLSRARDQLRGRLSRRGVTPALVAGGALVGVHNASAAIPETLGRLTIRAARELAAGMTANATAVALAEGVAKELTMAKIRLMAGAVLLMGLVAAGTFTIAARPQKDDPPRAIVPALEPLPDAAIVRKALKEWWDGIKTLEFRDVTCNIYGDSLPILEGEHRLVEVVLGEGNKRSVTHGTLLNDGKVRVVQEKRDNGTTQFYLLSNAENPDRITSVTITDQRNTRDKYHDEMGTLLWLLTPSTSGLGGACMPLHLHIDNPDTVSKIEIGRDANGKPTVGMFLSYGSQRYELDPDHDYLPRRVTGTINDINVTKFARQNGRWFPVEGVVTHRLAAGEVVREAFVVQGLKINQPIPDSRFEMPVDSDGIRVLDRRIPRR